MEHENPGNEPKDTLGEEGWRVYVEMARAEYQQEEDRWRSAQDKAKTIFAVAALVATLMFGRLDWVAARTAGNWERWLWLGMLCIGSFFLIWALVITAKVFTPKWAFRMEPSDVALKKLPRLPKWQMQQYLGEAYANTVSKNACVIDRELRRVRKATWLLVVSLIIALLQLAFALAVPMHTTRRAAKGTARGQEPSSRTSRRPTASAPAGRSPSSPASPPATGRYDVIPEPTPALAVRSWCTYWTDMAGVPPRSARGGPSEGFMLD